MMPSIGREFGEALPAVGVIKMPFDAFVGGAQVVLQRSPLRFIDRADSLPNLVPIHMTQVAPEHAVFEDAQIISGVGDVGGDGGAIAHGLRCGAGVDVGEALEEGCALSR